jgi:hypothetical protein
MDLPVDDAAALAMAQSGLGRWQWDESTARFVLGKMTSATRTSARGADQRP